MALVVGRKEGVPRWGGGNGMRWGAVKEEDMMEGVLLQTLC